MFGDPSKSPEATHHLCEWMAGRAEPEQAFIPAPGPGNEPAQAVLSEYNVPHGFHVYIQSLMNDFIHLVYS